MRIFAVRRLRRRLVFTAVAALAVAGLAVSAVSATAALPSTPEGWELVWSDDFDGPANTLPSSSNWIIDTGTGYPGGPGGWGTGEVQTYTDSPTNLRLDGSGNLEIVPVRSGSTWTSGRIETRRADFAPPAGGVMRMEGRVRMPAVTGDAALGYWPAFWALGAPYRGNYWNWPGIGELDLMENVNGINSVWGTLHCGVNPGGPCNETTGLGNRVACPASTCQGNFHTYRFEWDRTDETAQQMRWYVDGQLFHTVNQSQVGSAWADLSSHAGYFILLNVAMGGAFPAAFGGGPTAATESGHAMSVDYVGVWTKSGGPTPTDTPTSTSTSTSTSTPTSTSTSTATSTSTTTTAPTGARRDAYATIQAESHDAQSGVTASGTAITELSNGDWARFDDVDFGTSTPRDFVARAASGAAGGVSGLVEVRLDSEGNPPIGSFAVANTGGWTSWREIPGNVSAVTGVHTVYLRFTSAQPADFVNVDWFTFRH